MKRNILAIAVLAAALAGCAAPSTTAPTPAATGPSVSTGLGTKDASADVAIGAVQNDPSLGWASAPVTVTNHSTGRSDYSITVVLESADGSTQIDSTYVMVTDLEPGQKTLQQAQFTKAAPAGAKVVATEVQRTASTG